MRSSCCAATSVVPEPEKKSPTMSPLSLKFSSSHCQAGIGLGHGWSATRSRLVDFFGLFSSSMSEEIGTIFTSIGTILSVVWCENDDGGPVEGDKERAAVIGWLLTLAYERRGAIRLT